MRRRLRPLLLLSGLMAAIVLAVPAHAQIDSREGIALQNQILELRHELELMQNQGGSAPVVRSAPVVSGGGANGEVVAQLLSRVDALEEAVRQLRGRVDELTNQQQVQIAALNKQIGDLGFQMQNQAGGARAGAPGAGALGAVPGAVPSVPMAPSTLGPQGGVASPTAPAPPTTQVTMRRTPELAIQEGNAALARRDYTTAEASAREVLSNNRTSPRAYDAQYLLAEALTGKRDYSQAAIAYDDAYRSAPKGVHSQDALLGLADSLTAINEKRAACDTLDQLRAQFPTPRPDLAAPIQSARQRAGCR